MQILSGSSDATLKLWSLAQQRCMSTLRGIHSEGIWTLAVNENFTVAFSAGRDSHIYATDLRTFKSYFIALEPDPIIRVRTPTRSLSISISAPLNTRPIYASLRLLLQVCYTYSTCPSVPPCASAQTDRTQHRRAVSLGGHYFAAREALCTECAYRIMI